MVAPKKRRCLAIVLAAGEGTRMRSPLPKVLHKVAGLSLIGHVLKTLKMVNCDNCAVILGKGAEDVEKEVKKHFENAEIFYQTTRLGTAHAVLSARKILEENYDDIFILFGDTPLIDSNFLHEAREILAKGCNVLTFGFHTNHPYGYGRLIEKNGDLVEIIEEKDASEEQKKITFCNGGLMALSHKNILNLLDKIDNKNAKGEFYLTDLIAIAHKENLKVKSLEVPFDNLLGVNTCLELSESESIWQQRKRKELLLNGVTMIDPNSVYFSYDTQIASGVVIEPNVIFGTNVVIETGAHIHAFTTIEKTYIHKGAKIGPYARLRPDTTIGEGAKIGNFCELKNAYIEAKAKINHLSYIGDAHICKNVNIGAGTITCNYDGFNKSKTNIEENAFIGSNTSLVAPIKIGKNAYIASGSVITKNVEEGALAIGRSRQENKENYSGKLKQKFLKSTNNKNK